MKLLTMFYYSLSLGISLKKNVLLNKLPLGIFEDIPKLKSLQIVELPEEGWKNLSLSLKNLEQLRITGASHHNPILPAHFLQDS